MELYHIGSFSNVHCCTIRLRQVCETREGPTSPFDVNTISVGAKLGIRLRGSVAPAQVHW